MKPDCTDWVRTVYEEHAPELYRLASHRLRDPDLARDLTQEVFLTLLDRAEQVRDHPKIMGWLVTTLNYKIRHELDRRADQARRQAPAEVLDWLPDRRDPHARSLDQVLPRQLSQRDRTVLKLIYEEGLTRRQAARVLGVSPDTCGTWIYRARQRCKACLSQEKGADKP